MANTKISALTANTNPTWLEELVYAYNNANGKMTLNTMKAFVGWAGITTLNADANIWELSGGTYLTAYNLFYKTWEKVPANQVTWATREQMLFVTEETNGDKGFLVFSVWHTSTNTNSYASFWWSKSSSDWTVFQLWARDWAIKKYSPSAVNYECDSFQEDTITQIVSDAYGTNSLRMGASAYEWITYTIYFNSIKSGDNYTVSLWTGITNPLWITLPSSSTKKSVVTVLATSTTTGIVTWCTIEP